MFSEVTITESVTNYSMSYTTYFKHHCSSWAIWRPLELKVRISDSTMMSIAPQRIAAPQEKKEITLSVQEQVRTP